MQMIRIFIFAILWTSHASAQQKPVFRLEEMQVQLLEMNTLVAPVWHDDAIAFGDVEAVRLFKSYFSPESYSSYKNFFLPGEWPGISMKEYEQWQKTISAKRLLLENTMHVKDPAGREYMILQYIMDGPAYAVYQSTEFKKTPSGWKHVHYQNDKFAPCLTGIGKIKIPKLQAMVSGSSHEIPIHSIPFQDTRSYTEKFNRKELFGTIETLLIKKGISQADRTLARSYFEYKDDVAFITHLCKTYTLDDVTLMQEINEETGMQIFNVDTSKKE